MINCTIILNRGRNGMAYIGYVIRKLREKNNMSQEVLAEGICTSKYIYLIEKGDRNPSSDILSQLGEKLDTDLFDFYEYIDCEDPVAVREMFNEFLKYRGQMNLVRLLKLNHEARALPDFQRAPWSYELKVNEYMYMLLIEKKYEEIKELLMQDIDFYDKNTIEGQCRTRLNILLALCYEGLGDIEKSCMVITNVVDSMKIKRNCYKDLHLIVMAHCTYMGIHSAVGNYENVISKGVEICKLQEEFNAYEMLHYCFFFLAFTYKKLHMKDRSRDFLEKGILLSLLNDKYTDISYLTDRGIIPELLKGHVISGELVDRFTSKYHLPKQGKSEDVKSCILISQGGSENHCTSNNCSI